LRKEVDYLRLTAVTRNCYIYEVPGEEEKKGKEENLGGKKPWKTINSLYIVNPTQASPSTS